MLRSGTRPNEDPLLLPKAQTSVRTMAESPKCRLAALGEPFHSQKMYLKKPVATMRRKDLAAVLDRTANSNTRPILRASKK